MSPRTADAIRKACAYALAIAVTVLMFRILSRLAGGRGTLLDWELWLALALFSLGIFWVKAARRVGRGASGSTPAPAASAGPAPADDPAGRPS